MNTLKMIALFALFGLADVAQAREDVVILRWPTGGDNSASASPMIDAATNLNLDTPTTGSKGDALRMTAVNLNLTTGDTTTSFAPTAFNETATRIIDTDGNPVRGIRIWINSATATQFNENIAGYGMVGFSIYGKTAANLRQGFIPVRIGQPIVLDNLFWSQTTGDSVSVFVESSIAGFTYHMQVIR